MKILAICNSTHFLFFNSVSLMPCTTFQVYFVQKPLNNLDRYTVLTRVFCIYCRSWYEFQATSDHFYDSYKRSLSHLPRAPNTSNNFLLYKTDNPANDNSFLPGNTRASEQSDVRFAHWHPDDC